ncbi:MAG TPA: cobalamin biosynthesis protein, partial [Desulfosporosinus sp.]|nr:cobalamin biosynthesis protein [Desulfosporosinus sp.]
MMYSVLLGFLLDQLIGDPRRWPHPVVGIGKIIAYLERSLNLGTPVARRRRGVLLTFLVVGGTYFITWAIVIGANALHPLVGLGVSAY